MFAGRLDKLKGIDILLEAWKEMGENAPKLIVCGTGPLEDWCKKNVAENRCNVELRGFVPNEETKRIIGKSRALILPTQRYEGFPMSIVEAYSVGTPVICSDMGNCASIMDDGKIGFNINIQSLEQLKSSIEDSSKLCFSTFNNYKETYTEDANYKKMISFYRKLLNK